MAGWTINFTNGQMPAGATTQRAAMSTGSEWSRRTSAAGAVEFGTSVDTPRFDRLPNGLWSLLIEPARTNHVLRSAQLNAAGWLQQGVTQLGAGQVSPAGTATQRIRLANGAFGVYQERPITVAAGALIAVSAYRRAVSEERAVALAINGVSNGRNNKSALAPVTQTWDRQHYIHTGVADNGLYVSPAATGGAGVIVASAIDLDITFVQMEAGPTPSSYIRTTTDPGVRPEESHQFAVPGGAPNGPLDIIIDVVDASGASQSMRATVNVSANRFTITRGMWSADYSRLLRIKSVEGADAITATAISPTEVRISTPLMAAGSPIEVQVGRTPSFLWDLGQIISVEAGLNIAVAGLNQAATYFFRARAILPNGGRGEWVGPVAAYTPVEQLRATAPQPILVAPAAIVLPETVLTWAASDEEEGAPARGLGRDDPAAVWKASDVGSGVSLSVTLPGAPIDTIAILETNAPEDATILVRAAGTIEDAQSVNAPFSYGPVPFRASARLPGRNAYHGLVRLPSAVAYPCWHIEISGTFTGDEFIATYAVFGRARMTRNFVVGSKSETVVDRGAVERDRSGAPSRISGRRGRTVDFEVVLMTEAQYETEFERIRWEIGATQPALVIPNSRAGAFLHDRILFGELRPGKATYTHAGRFSQDFSINSLI